MKKIVKIALFVVLLFSCLMLTACNANVGIGMSVGVPIGDHGYISIGSGRWL